MTRHRALLFGQPLAPWKATRELAEQVAIEAGEGSRQPHDGRIFLAAGVTIESDDGEAQLTPDMERWAEALAVLKIYGERAPAYASDQLIAARDDLIERARWRAVRHRILVLLDDAMKRDRH